MVELKHILAKIARVDVPLTAYFFALFFSSLPHDKNSRIQVDQPTVNCGRFGCHGKDKNSLTFEDLAKAEGGSRIKGV